MCAHVQIFPRDTATLPLFLEDWVFEVPSEPSAFWASWERFFACIHARHLAVTNMILKESVGNRVRRVSRSVRDLVGVGRSETPSWISLVNGARTCANQRIVNPALRQGGSRQHPELNGVRGCRVDASTVDMCSDKSSVAVLLASRVYAGVAAKSIHLATTTLHVCVDLESGRSCLQRGRA